MTIGPMVFHSPYILDYKKMEGGENNTWGGGEGGRDGGKNSTQVDRGRREVRQIQGGREERTRQHSEGGRE